MSQRMTKGLSWLKTVMFLSAAFFGTKALFGMAQPDPGKEAAAALIAFFGTFLVIGIPAFALGWATGQGRISISTHPIEEQTHRPAIVETTTNDSYAEALAEIEEGRLDKGVWARSFADSDGDESKAKASYIKARVESLKEAAVWEHTQPPAQDVPAAGLSSPPAVAPPSPLWWLAGIAVIGIVAAVAPTYYRGNAERQESKVTFGEGGKIAVPPNSEATPGSDKGVTAPTEAYSQIAEFLDDGRPTAPTAEQLGVAVVSIEREIESAYNSRMLPTVADIELRYNVFRTEAGGAALQRLKQKIEAKMAGFVHPNSPPPMRIAAPANQATPQRRFSAQVQADLNRIAERAMKDYPYLDTPAGQEVLSKIIKRRDVLIEQGEYPSIALTRAINDFAPAYAPSTGQENRPNPVDAAPATTSNMGNQPGFAPECRWVTPQKWSCK